MRTIQQRDLPHLDPNRRVLGIIRPTAESIDTVTHSRHIGILATEGTIKSHSYKLEVQKLFPDGNNGMSVNATRLVVRALELRIIDIDNLHADEE